jgi:methionine-rich copper-binding protein CopC
MSVALKTIGPGTYHVHWHVLSVDTHKTEGNFVFHVGGR